MDEGIIFFVFYVSDSTYMKKKTQVPNAGIRVKFCEASIIQDFKLVSCNGSILCYVDLKKLNYYK